MKGKTKEQKGITLIALIITIVVLMILAAVAISAIQNDGILGFAKQAADQYNKEQQSEKDILGGYELFLQGKAWTQNGTIVTRGDVTLEVGDIVDFNSGVEAYDNIVNGNKAAYSLSGFEKDAWRVLGVENGHLLLVSGRYVGEATISTINAEGKTFIEQMEELDKICAPFGKNAVSARSIKVEDINRITGYNPNKTGTGDPYSYPLDNSDPVSDYGRKVTYKFTEDGKVQFSYTDDNGSVRTDTVDGVFKKIGENTNVSELNTDSGFTVTCDSYTYQLDTLTSNKTAAVNAKLPTVVNVMADPDINSMLSSAKYGAYWLNNTVARTRAGSVLYTILTVRNNVEVGGETMWLTSEAKNYSASNRVRAVVYVNPDAVLKEGVVTSTQSGLTVKCWVFEKNNNQQ